MEYPTRIGIALGLASRDQGATSSGIQNAGRASAVPQDIPMEHDNGYSSTSREPLHGQVDITFAPDSSKPEDNQSLHQNNQESRDSTYRYEPLSRCYAKVLRSRDLSFRTRVEARMSSRKYLQLRAKARKSQHRFTDLLRTVKANGDWESRSNELDQLAAVVETDFHAMESQLATMQSAESRLVSLEYHRTEQEDEFFAALSTSLRECGLWDQAQLGLGWFLGGLNAPTQSSITPALDPLLEDYFDKAGDVGIIGERFANLDIEYQESLALRKLRKEQEMPLSPSDSMFETRYQTTRSAIKYKLGQAILAADAAKEACLKAGLDPHGHSQAVSEPSVRILPRNRHSEASPDEVSRYSDSNCALGLEDEPRMKRFRPQTLSTTIPSRASSNLGLDGSIAARRRVEDWVSNLVNSPPESPPLEPLLEPDPVDPLPNPPQPPTASISQDDVQKLRDLSEDTHVTVHSTRIQDGLTRVGRPRAASN